MILLIVLALLAIYAIWNVKQDVRLEKLKKMHKEFLSILPPKYDALKKKRTILTGTYRQGVVGENVNKGAEITVCLDGDDVNSMFHILLHELAHSSVREYDHSSEFWDNYKELTKIAVDAGLYKTGVNTEFCGKSIRDGFTSLEETGGESRK